MITLPRRALALLGDKADTYRARVLRDFETIEPWLQPGIKTILDIGCGLAGVNVYLAEETGATEIILMDGDGGGHRKMGFVVDTQAWSDVRDGAELVNANVQGTSVFSYRADEKLLFPCDLIISLKSWAHHYPASTYMRLASESLRPKGRIIVDIRTGTDGLNDFTAAGFKSIGIAHETAKAKRHVFERAQ